MNKTFSLIFLCTLILTSCVSLQKGIVTFEKQPNEIFTKESLKNYLSANQNPKIVLRVPKAEPTFRHTSGEISTKDRIYNTIEKELLKAGFNVKDRDLFNEIISKSSTNDYEKIMALTDTELILEVVDIHENIEYRTNRYVSYKKGHERKLTLGDITLYGASMEFKVILVNSREVAGTFEFNFSPCTEGCGFYIGQRGGLYRRRHIYSPIIPPYEIVESDAMDEFIAAATQELIQNLR